MDENDDTTTGAPASLFDADQPPPGGEEPAAQVETPPDPAAPAAAEPTEATPPPSVVQRLIGAEQPAWMRAARRAAEGQPIAITEEQWRDLDPAAQAILYNAHLELEKGNTEAAQLQADQEAREEDLRARERALLRERTSLQTGMADALRSFVTDKLQPLKDGQMPDPDTEAGLEARVQKLAYGVLNGFIDQIGNFEKQRFAQLQDQERAHTAQTEEKATRTFIREHLEGDGPLQDREVVSEFVDMRGRGYELDEALERAQAVVAARRGDDDDRIVQRVAARRRTMGSQAGADRIPATPNGSVNERLAFYERYPEAKQRDIREALKIKRGL